MGRKKRGQRNQASGSMAEPVDERLSGPVDAHWTGIVHGSAAARRFGPAAAPVPVSGPGPSPPPLHLAVVAESEEDVDYNKIQFLMRGVRFGYDGCRYLGKYYERNEFYKVCIEKKDEGEFEFVGKQWCESQLNCLGSCSMHRVNSRIYNISRFLFVDDVNSLPQSLTFTPTTTCITEKLDCHKSLSWIDLEDPKKWNPGASLTCYELNVECCVFGQNIYALQSGVLEPRCYLTLENKWVKCNDKPPKELKQCSVNDRMILQPSNNRILVHITTSDYSASYLYGWSPHLQHSHQHPWEFITKDIHAGLWDDGHPILLDDIIYFYDNICPPYFAAYDLTTKNWVQVKWSAQFSSDAAGYKADSMFYLGNRLLCLAKSRPIDILNSDGIITDAWGTRVTFSLFRFQTTPMHGPFIIFTHLLTKSLACPGIHQAVDFISLVQDEVK